MSEFNWVYLLKKKANNFSSLDTKEWALPEKLGF